MAAPFQAFATGAGTYGSKSADLFPMWAVAKATAALGADIIDKEVTAKAVYARRTMQGGLGAQVGQVADAWSTAYGAEILTAIGVPVPASLTDYLVSLLDDDGGFAMAVGQSSETWSTAFAISGLVAADVELPDAEATLTWLASAMVASGGFTWSPTWTGRGRADVRATGFVMKALQASGLLDSFLSMVDIDPTVEFLQRSQDSAGGFRLDERHPPCMWGVGEAVVALDVLGHRPLDVDGCLDFVAGLANADGGHRRGPDYTLGSDTWATMHAVLVNTAIGAEPSAAEASATVAFLQSCTVAEGGYTYRPPEQAPDVLTTSGVVLTGSDVSADTTEFLHTCRMPGEGGVAFMPSRGSEARSAMWTTTALVEAGAQRHEPSLGEWARHAQSPEGGFGPWEGRAPSPISTNAVLATLTNAGVDLATTIDLDLLRDWIRRIWPTRLAPEHNVDLVDVCSLAMASDIIIVPFDRGRVLDVLDAHTRDGAWRRSLQVLPDLLSTYAALVAHQAIGHLDLVLPAAAGWVRQLPVDDAGIAWSPLSSSGGGPMATALAHLITSSADTGRTIPNLTL